MSGEEKTECRPMPWCAEFRLGRGALLEPPRSLETVEPSDWWKERMGLVQCYCGGMHLSIWLLASCAKEAEKIALARYKSVVLRESVGHFKFLRRMVFSPTGDMSQPFEYPYYTFDDGLLVVPERGKFIMPDGTVSESDCFRVKGSWLYRYEKQNNVLSKYDDIYSMLKKRNGEERLS